MTVGKTFVPLFLVAALAGCAKPPSRFRAEPLFSEPTKDALALFDAMQALKERAQAAGIDSYRLELSIMDAFDAASEAAPSCGKTAIATAVRFYIGDKRVSTAGVLHEKVEKFVTSYCGGDKKHVGVPGSGYAYAIPVVQRLNP